MSIFLIKLIQFFVSLSLLVMIHEFGHYIAARIFKIRVEKFYIFFNPWFTPYKKKIGETEYGVGWLPLGGYVSLSGMIDESMNVEQMKQEPQPWEFRTKPAWQRLIVMLAGVIMNVILAMIIYAGILFTWGETYLHNDNAVHGYAFNDAGKELGFPCRIVHLGIACPGLGLPDGEAELRALVQEFEELGVQRVNLHSQFGEAGDLGGLCHGTFLIFPECLP
jgi:regulator of sigma E protease